MSFGGAKGSAVPDAGLLYTPPQTPKSLSQTSASCPQTLTFTTHSGGTLAFCDIFPCQKAAHNNPIDLQLWKALESGGQRRRGRHVAMPPGCPEREGFRTNSAQREGEVGSRSLILMNHIFKGPISKSGHILKYWGLAHQHIFLGDTVQLIKDG